MAPKVDAETRTNTIDPARAGKLITQMEKINEDFLAHKMAYVASCAPFQKRRADKIQEASDFGIPKNVFKAKIKEREHLRKAGAIADDFEDEQRDSYEQLTQALGGLADLPLGRAAQRAHAEQPPAPAEPKPRGRPRKAPSPVASSTDAAIEADDKDLRPTHMQRNEADRAEDLAKDLADERAAEDNRKRLEGVGGITPLH